MTMVHHSDEASSPDHLQRKLSNRHLQLIANWRCNRYRYLWARAKPSPLAGHFNSRYLHMLIGGYVLFPYACIR